jgi:Ala-tRNA(Pro) deacylase
MGLATKTLRHPPVFTVEEAKALRGDLPGAHTKNLFLRDKKGRMWLLVALADSKVELKRLARVLGARGLSFASPERLLNIPLEI